jgi:hypothetical protein
LRRDPRETVQHALLWPYDPPVLTVSGSSLWSPSDAPSPCRKFGHCQVTVNSGQPEQVCNGHLRTSLDEAWSEFHVRRSRRFSDGSDFNYGRSIPIMYGFSDA